MQRRQFITSVPVGMALLGTGVAAGSKPVALDADHIVLGSTSALTGVQGVRGTEALAGMTAAISSINRAGGVNGRELKLVALDDAYVPERSVANVNRLIESENMFALMSCVGTANNAAIIPIIEKAGVPYVGPMSGALSLRTPGQRNTFHIRAGYGEEVQRLTQQLVNMGLKDIGMLYLDNSYGVELSGELASSLQTVKLKPVASVAVAVDGRNVNQAIGTLLAARPSVVVLATTGSASTDVIQKLRDRQPGLPMVGVSVSVIGGEILRLGPAAQGLALTQVFPDATSAKNESVRVFQEAMRASGSTAFTASSFEGYVNAMVLIDGLRRAGRDPSRDKLRTALAGIRQMRLGEFTISFDSAAPYIGSHYVQMGVLGQGGRFMA